VKNTVYLFIFCILLSSFSVFITYETVDYEITYPCNQQTRLLSEQGEKLMFCRRDDAEDEWDATYHWEPLVGFLQPNPLMYSCYTDVRHSMVCYNGDGDPISNRMFQKGWKYVGTFPSSVEFAKYSLTFDALTFDMMTILWEQLAEKADYGTSLYQWKGYVVY
jgi:hypothetical protein